jgi:hypothetical protein
VPRLRTLVIAGMTLAPAAAPGGPSRASGAKAVFAAGGLQVAAADDLRMEEETLTPSPAGAAVRQRFRNLASGLRRMAGPSPARNPRFSMMARARSVTFAVRPRGAPPERPLRRSP